MALRWFGWLIALSACSSHAAAVNVADAAPDVDYCASPHVLTPVTITGTSPRSSLDIFHYAVAGHVRCPDGGVVEAYVVELIPIDLDPSCASALLELYIYPPFSTTGTNSASADMTVQPGALNDETNATFEATQIDPPDATLPRIAGHFVPQDNPAWSFDIAVDLTSQFESDCL